MNFWLIVISIISLFLCCRSCFLQTKIKEFSGLSEDVNFTTSYLNALQVIRKHGYPAEAHTVVTEDGYLLQVHRIPRGKKEIEKQKNPILMQHGLLTTSMDFLYIEPGRDLAFLLADLGFDVWLGNLRGNLYSKAHISLDPCDNDFWDFTWEESGLYDVPATIDFILEKTNSQKLHFIGHSMGTTVFFVMLSMRPEYNNKIIRGYMMSPIAFLKNMKSPIFNLLAPFSNTVNFLTQSFNSGAFLPGSGFWKNLIHLACNVSYLSKSFCTNIIFLVVGDDREQWDKNFLALFTYHYPSEYSVKALVHYAQLHFSGEFRQYNYGPAQNILHYGSTVPPSYPLSNITAPIILYAAQNDLVATPPDVQKLVQHLPSIIDTHIIQYEKFSHLDFLMGKDVKTMLYDKMIRDILM